jgi:hypothetical protein
LIHRPPPLTPSAVDNFSLQGLALFPEGLALNPHIAGMTGACHPAQILLIEIGRVSHELFAWANLEPPSSQSAPTE